MTSSVARWYVTATSTYGSITGDALDIKPSDGQSTTTPTTLPYGEDSSTTGLLASQN
uniref:Uncharacterized protein n=1 Tax=Oryza sativa subsp. japonica TaxID=39947 RepID=Q6H4D5_ORYSJ|nr:hypothetical protein [Oryza sativa Japonica Group]BAD26414.1 hypothetical protein [Oryza sativa Japonica Group]